MNSGRWGTAKYIEDLHRQYGKPLPKRNDGDFERAMEYRQREKQWYNDIVKENETLRRYLEEATRDHAALLNDANNVMTAWQSSRKVIEQLSEESEMNPARYPHRKPELSKVSEDNVVLSDPGSSTAVLHNSGDEGGKAKNDTTVQPVGDVRKRRGKRSDNEVSGEVLSSDIPDPRGQADEHSKQGRQPGEGVHEQESDPVSS